MIKDDYYSSLQNSSSENTPDDKKPQPKLKLKIKKKVVVKKKEAAEIKVEETAPKQVEVAETPKAEVTPPKPVARLVHRPAETTPEKKPGFTHQKRTFSWEKRPFTPRNGNTQWAPRTSQWNSQAAKTPASTGPKITERWASSNQNNQKFSSNSPKGGSGWGFLNKWGKWAKNKNKRYDRSEKPVDKGFVRSNKIGGEKKEKNIEDIKQNLTDRSGETIIVWDVLTLKEFSEKIGVPLAKLMGEFMKNGMMVNLNSKVDYDSASIVAEAFDIKLDRDKSAGANLEDIVSKDMSALLLEDDSTKLKDRPAIVSIMGHVDHGKTSLLDYIRSAKVADGEAGWITQSIGAYQVEVDEKRITFLDTPGHEAFSVMRARWAKSTDIAILVVAADEWVKPQTIESVNHAKEAGIPVIVAINKMDKEGANPDHIKWQLAEHGLVPEDWSGDTPMVPVSAQSGFWIDDLLEVVLLVAEMAELKANPDRLGVGTVIESHLDKNLGPISSILVNAGSFNVWDNIVCGNAYWKIKVLKNHLTQKVKLATVSQPALIVWLDKVVDGGDIVQVVQSADIARKKVEEYDMYLHNEKEQGAGGLDLLMSRIKSGNLKQLKVVVKADSNGSVEALKAALLKLWTEETEVLVIHSWVGNINLWDMLMCQWSSAILIAFGVKADTGMLNEMENAKIEFIESKIIYHITERIEKIVTGMLDPKETEVTLSEAKVWGIFFTDKKFMIVGLILKQEESTIEKWAQIRVLRAGNIVGSGEVKVLKQWVEEVNRVEWPTECGIKFKWDIALEMGDVLDIYKIVKG